MLFISHLASFLAIAATMTAAIPTPTNSTSLAKRDAYVSSLSNLAVQQLTEEPNSSHCGVGTIYTQEGGTGSCGHTLPDSALIIALSNHFQLHQAPGPFCGRKIQVTNTGSNDGVGGKGNSIIATVEDTCPSCDENHLDLSAGAWNQLTDNAAYGTIDICWYVPLLRRLGQSMDQLTILCPGISYKTDGTW